MADEIITNAPNTDGSNSNSDNQNLSATSINGGGDPNVSTSESGSTTSVQTEKTFTQAELDKAISDRLSRERKNMPSKEELKAFKAYQETLKTPEQKADDFKQEKINSENRIKQLEIRVACLSKGVNTEFCDDAIALVERYIDDDVSIDSAITKVLERYPSFKGAVEIKKDTGIITTGTHTKPSSNNEYGTFKTVDIIKQNQVKRK